MRNAINKINTAAKRNGGFNLPLYLDATVIAACMKTLLYGGAQIIKDTNRSRAPGFLRRFGTFTPIT